MLAAPVNGVSERRSNRAAPKEKSTSQPASPVSAQTRRDWSRHGLISPDQHAKTFVLDTNVLLHDPGCLERFADNHVCIPVDVLSELDRFKNEQNDRGASARAVHRRLSEIFHEGGSAVTAGVPTPGGGTVRLATFSAEDHAVAFPALTEFLNLFPVEQKVDHKILACALVLQELNTAPVVLVTKDINLQLKARAIGVACDDYLNDKAEVRDVSSYDLKRLAVDPMELQRFASSGEITLPPSETSDLAINEYVLLQVSEKQTMPARHAGRRRFIRLQVPEAVKIPKGQAIKPLNLGQQCLLDALLDPDIPLVTCYGQAGTGKTLMAVAAGLSEVYQRRYDGMTVSRPVVAMGETLGFLPGTLNEKLRPWLQPVYDALDLVMRPAAAVNAGPRRKQERKSQQAQAMALNGAPKPYDSLIEQGILEIEALCYIRGRSIPNRFFILDEAQQLTPLEAKTIVTRMSRGSKLVLIGDPAQIDNPYVDSRSNGLVYTRNRLKGEPCAAHISLSKGERSPLAEAGARLM
ncbi:MAG: PhoH family protein [Verrucomicrobiaceae bacterium]|nr:MAG: PhoH family protein [Verrucomicrobiaceae bacterium]